MGVEVSVEVSVEEIHAETDHKIVAFHSTIHEWM